MLMIGAGLLMRSFHRLARVDIGFDPNHLLTASFDFSHDFESDDDMDRAISDFVARVRTLPGVTSVAGSLPLPLGGADFGSVSFNRLDRPVPESEYPSAGFYLVTGEFFRTMQIPLQQGRLFDERDQRNSAPVMIISHAFANKFFPGEDPIGRKIYISAGEGSSRERYQTREIIGVVSDIRITDLSRQPAPAFYVPLSQMLWGTPHIIVRIATPDSAIAPAIAKTLAAVDPSAPLYDVRTMNDWLVFDLGRARFQTVLLALFAGLALMLTAVGLYGVIAYTVTQRKQEIGVRVALGASTVNVISMVLRFGLRLVFIGITIGAIGAFALAKIMGEVLYQVRPRDPMTFIVVCFTSALVGMLASCVPALRATRIDPWISLTAK
jgi:putative ABC transport system permease protein